MFKSIFALIALVAVSQFTFAQKAPMVGGAAMDPKKNIVENASQANNLTTLVAAVKAADLVETLSGPGPFTVFAPTNDAFDKLPKGTVETLLKPENKAKLADVLTYHVIPGKVTAADLMKTIRGNRGKAKVKTVAGVTFWAMMNGKNVVLTDEKGNSSTIIAADINQSNGVVHVIDSVLLH